MIQPGDVVTVAFPGVTGTKRRPAIVLSTDVYHRTRPDLILGLITSRTADATQPSDYVLQDSSHAGLRRPSAFRAFLVTVPAYTVTAIGHVSARDWGEIQHRLQLALSVA